MNRITKTIASADSVEELSELVMTALNASLGIGKALLVSFSGGVADAIGSYNIDKTRLDDAFYENIRNHLEDQPLVYYTIEEYQKAFGDMFLGYLEGVNCFVLTPMFINASSIEPFGYLLITEARDRLHESQVNMLGIMANSIAPLLNQLLVVNQYSTNFTQNPKHRIEELMLQYTEEHALYGLPFRVYIKQISLLPFQTFDDASISVDRKSVV